MTLRLPVEMDQFENTQNEPRPPGLGSETTPRIADRLWIFRVDGAEAVDWTNYRGDEILKGIGWWEGYVIHPLLESEVPRTAGCCGSLDSDCRPHNVE